MNTPASAVVPSREEIGKIRSLARSVSGQLWADDEVIRMLRTLLAKVERLDVDCIRIANIAAARQAEVERLNDRNEILDIQLTAAVQEYQKALATVAEQGTEVERLTGERDEILRGGQVYVAKAVGLLTTVAQLERTVADQAAALAERDKDAERYRLDPACAIKRSLAEHAALIDSNNQLMIEQQDTPQDSVPAWAWRQAIGEARYDNEDEHEREAPVNQVCDWIESRALALAQTTAGNPP